MKIKNIFSIEKYEYDLLDLKKTEKGVLAYLVQTKYLYNYKKMLGLKIPSRKNGKWDVRLKIGKGIVAFGDKGDWRKVEVTDNDGIKIKSRIANKKLLKYLNKNVKNEQS